MPVSAAALAESLGRVPPSCGPVRLVAVDGHAGSGKSTFADWLARGEVPVVHLDDVATHDELFGWTRRLRATLLEPLARGADAEVPVYDWVARRFGPAVRVPCAPLVLIEGVGAGRAALRPYLARVLWMDVDQETAGAAGRLRDGPELDAFWARWTRAEREHFAADPTRPFAHATVSRRTGGYAITPGPRAVLDPDFSDTA
ncbi:hypothetical protein POF50_023270 [Streptomyces sp. SL13]|uniref:Uridine kinase n=1 Tax=Streptantibioticus silvisoli TaxID=2705255 RepID=A0AA90H774_9ACTN|nr:hypothetical protein [Streptantibioticus silvisoli]MDI5964745.1 hypothetical protein [Streptantibioticus silvisoli]MDI5972220.1 hypothetical protein [Streptantibioticus silvisoli]